MAPLPSKEFEEADGYDDDEDVPDADPNKKSPKDIKQLLLRTMATEVLVGKDLDGEVAVVQSDFQWFATGISHSTIFAVITFLGFQEDWLVFFLKALCPPMDMLDGDGARTRRRGLPMAHIFEKLLGELVLFFMDLAVARTSGMILYQFHDDLWLAGNPSNCADAWQSMESFAKIMGLEFNQSKTGSAYLTDGRKRNSSVEKVLPKGPVMMDFLVLDADTGKWNMNEGHIEHHVKQLKRQLDESSSVLQWVKTWNSCIGRFFSYTFGEPAHCFGADHLDKILKTHRDMQRHLFDNEETGTTVTEQLKHKISQNFNIDAATIPNSFLFMPESLGGLGLKNPFISLLLLRKDLCKDPEERMLKFRQTERERYDSAKKLFDSLSAKERRKRYKAAFLSEEDDTSNPVISWDEAQTFMSFEAYTAKRELTSWPLYETYKCFLQQPSQEKLVLTKDVSHALRSLSYVPDVLESVAEKGKGKRDEEFIWTLQFFKDELFEKFGGLEVVDRGLLPWGV